MFRTAFNDRFAVTEDFQVHADSFQTQSEVQLAALPNGGFIAVWMGTDGFNDPGIKAQMFNSDGRPVGDEFLVNQITVNPQVQPSVSVLSTGGFIITWSEERAYPDVFDIKGQIFDANGERLGTEFVVNTATSGFQTNSTVTVLANGGFVVTWEHADSGFDDIRAQVFSADGTPVGGEIIASDATTGDKVTPDVVALTGGGFVISWFSWSAEIADEFGNLSPGSRAQLFDASGNKVGEAFALNTFVEGYQQNAALAALPTGGFVAAWADNGTSPLQTDTGHRGIWIQLFDASGQKIGGEIKASSLGPFGQDGSAVTIVPGTGFLVTWQDGNATDDNVAGHLRAQLFDFNGTKIGDEIAVTTLSQSEQLQADTITLTSGAIVLGWTDRTSTPSTDEDVHATILYPISHGTAGDDTLQGGANRDFIMGQGGNDIIVGAAEDDGLNGGAGNDILDGGAGADAMAGGAGSDTYIVDNASDVTVETSPSAGIDSVLASVSFSLGGQYVDNLTLTGGAAINATGNGLANVLTGNGAVNTLTGLGGNDTLNGNGGNDILDGGAGADAMAGGAGNDTYIVDNASDVVTESSPSGGNDRIYSSVSYSLGGRYVEQLTLTGVAAINATGNGLNNILIGNLAVNRLSGLDGNDTLDGGAGADTMAGGAGNDTYIVDNASDVTVETGPAAGIDSVLTSVSFSLGGQYVDNLTLTGGAAINATGNGLANVLTGNDAVNTLTGLGGNDTLNGNGGNDTLDGGTGADTMAGGAGNDTYIVDNASDVTVETGPAAGIDSVLASVSFSLGGQYVDNLTLTGGAAINATGNGLANVLTGNDAVNTLAGLGGNDTLNGNGGNDTLDGGTGSDNMSGGAGNDTYIVDNVSDVTVETGPSAGIDSVLASVSFSLGGQYVDNLTLTGGAAINATGNGLANVLTGNDAVNTLTGLGGNDTLNGGAGNDILDGGAGADKFVFAGVPGSDTIADFVSGTDRIDLSAYGISAAQVSASPSGSNTILAIDSNSDGAADFTITLLNAGTPASGDYDF